MASTMMTLNSSLISAMKPVICLMRRSTEASLPVWMRALVLSSYKKARTYLEQSGDSIGGNAPVLIRDEVLQVNVAGSDALGVVESKSSKCSGSSEFEHRFGGGQE